MNLPQLIDSALSADSQLTTLVGSKVYQLVAPPESGDRYVVWQEVSVVPEVTHEGPSELEDSLYQFTCYAESPSVARQMRSRIRAVLEQSSAIVGAKGVVRSLRSLTEPQAVPFRYRCDVDISFLAAPLA